MNENKKTYFISDLHLDETRPEITRLFLNFLKQCEHSVNALYVLGDLFEVWIGDDENTIFQSQIIQAFKTATESGLPIYFLHGNRDFLIGQAFLEKSGCRWLPDEHLITLNNKQILLMHGDTLCTQDTAYLKFRKIVRNPFIKKIFLAFPLIIRKKLANKLRAASQKHTQSTMPAIMDVDQHEVERIMEAHHVDYLIHGHTHRPGIHTFKINGHASTRMVLGAWHELGSVLIADEEEHFELINIG